jgi:hypothetical protein
METVESSLSKGIPKNKKTMRSMVVVLYLQDWSKGINERSELPPAKVEVEVEVEFEFEVKAVPPLRMV